MVTRSELTKIELTIQLKNDSHETNEPPMKMTLESLKTESFPQLSGSLSNIRGKLSSMLADFPYIVLQGDNNSIEVNSEEISLRVTKPSDQEDGSNISIEALNAISRDASYLIGIIIGASGMELDAVKSTLTLTFDASGMFKKSFDVNFNQAFIAKQNIDEVKGIWFKEKSSSEDISVSYRLTIGESIDSAEAEYKFTSFNSPLNLNSYVETEVEKLNKLLENWR